MPLSLCFGVHNHQPLGNFPWVFEDVARLAYRPFLQTLNDIPTLRVSLHVSGPLLQWCETHDRAYLDLIGNLIDSGIVEPLCAGFYEPVLAALPKEDRRAQIQMMREYLHCRFGVWPQGLWLTERVWEASLVEDLCRMGVKYIIVDDRHFLTAGFSPDALHTYYLTEEGGQRLAIFPIAQRLRYYIPFRPTGEVGAYLRELAAAGHPLAIFADDGEKFGAWPHTHALVYGEGWLRRFLKMIGKLEADGVMSLTFGQALQRLPPAGVCYLPTASYVEMEEWTLPPERVWELQALKARLGSDLKRCTAFVRGGHWRNFFVRYSEANRMHKMVLRLSRELRSRSQVSALAEQEIYAAQCNDAYWHGIFGGLYLPHLRHEVWRRIARAEGILRKGEPFTVAVEDVDLDGRDEVMLHSDRFSCWLRPGRGGQIATYIHFGSETNYLNTLTRRREVYHVVPGEPTTTDSATGAGAEEGTGIHQLVKGRSAELDEALGYDAYERLAAIERCMPPDVDLAVFRQGGAAEWGDFVTGPFTWERDGGTFRLAREGRVAIPGRLSTSAGVTKIFRFAEGGRFTLTDQITNREAAAGIECSFGVEWNLFPAALALGGGICRVNGQDVPWLAAGEWQAVDRITLVDQATQSALELSWDRPATLWAFPVETVSQSERGLDRTTQALCFFPHWPIRLRPGEAFEVTFTWEIRPLET